METRNGTARPPRSCIRFLTLSWYTLEEYAPMARKVSRVLRTLQGSLAVTRLFAPSDISGSDHTSSGHLNIQMSKLLSVHCAMPYRIEIRGFEITNAVPSSGAWKITPTWTNSVPKYRSLSLAIQRSLRMTTPPMHIRYPAVSVKSASIPEEG